MKRLTVVFIASFVVLLFTSYAFAAKDWVDQAIEDNNRGNSKLAKIIIQNHEVDFKTAERFSEAGCVYLAIEVWKRYVCYGNNSSRSNKAKAYFLLGEVQFRLSKNRNLVLAIDNFTNSISLDNSYRKKIIHLSQGYLFYNLYPDNFYNVKYLSDSIKGFGANTNTARNYKKAIAFADNPKINNNQLIICLDMAFLFTFTDKQRVDIGNRYLEIARNADKNHRRSLSYERAENILGANVVNQIRHGASVKK